MGQKVNPVGMRLGITRCWNSQWFTRKNMYSSFLKFDLAVRRLIRHKFSKHGSIGNIFIERADNNVKITIYTSKPGVIIGKKGSDIDSLRIELSKMYSYNFTMRVKVITNVDLNATLVAENIATQLEQRVSFKRAMKRAAASSIKQGARGVKISISGRLAGADIARTEWHREGRVPLHTFSADIDYAQWSAKTKYGVIGVKVWIYRPSVDKL